MTDFEKAHVNKLRRERNTRTAVMWLTIAITILIWYLTK